MKKTSFFNGKNYFLLVLLGWLLVLDGAARLNNGQGRESASAPKAKEAQEAYAGEESEAQEAYAGKESEAQEAYAGEESEVRETDAGEESEAQEAAAGEEPEEQETSAGEEPEAQETAAGEEPKSEDSEGKSLEAARDIPTAPGQEPEIRVLLMDSGYTSYYHPFVEVTIEGRTVTYTPDSPELSEGAVILDGGEDGISISSIHRQEDPPVYQGTLEIKTTEKGLLLVNCLPLETYLEAVVPSEMPASYEKQALMAQAVCARTYAVRQIEEEALAEYGADVDDSVNYQVYRNYPPEEASTKAIRETEGQIICQDGEPVTAYYFSTSAGVTSTDEIWGADQASPYLQSVECTFDSQEPWSHWSVEIPWSTLKERANSQLGCTGELMSIEIVKKSESGAVTGLLAVTDQDSALVSQEYEVRQFLSPQGLTVTEGDGTQIQGGSLLPSAYFTLRLDPGNLVLAEGSGYGHGVGMSQTAANQMAKEGYTYEEILKYFFKDIELMNI